jgi:coenzyme F420-reducing hydrogenase delta subunit
VKAVIFAAVLLAFYFVLDALGAGEHASIIAGMPKNDASFVLGPLYALARMSAIIVAPISILGASIDGLVRVARADSSARRDASAASIPEGSRDRSAT